MTATIKTRPPAPETPGSGLEYVPVPAQGWRVAEPGATCRWYAPSVGGPVCGEPATAEQHRPRDLTSPWWPYCAEHLQGKSTIAQRVWAEDGAVMKWELRYEDGTVPTLQEIARARAKHARTREQRERVPADTGPHPIRLRNDLWADAENAARAARMTTSGWIRQAMHVMLGELRCPRCRDDAPPVPLEFGDLAGMTLAEAVADAAEQVKRQHPRHEPVTAGAAAAARPSPLGDVPFKSPAVKR